jgi:hypothetical protein
MVTSVAAQLPGIAVDFSLADAASGQPGRSVRRNDWRWSPIRVSLRAAREAVPRNLEYVTGRLPAPRPTAAPSGSLSSRLAFSLNFWWLYLFYLGVLSRMTLVIVVATLISGAAVMGLAVVRRLRQHDAGDRARAI